MPISRPLLIVLIGAVLALAGFYATQGSRNSTGDAPAEVTPPPSAQPQADASNDASAAPVEAAQSRAPRATAEKAAEQAAADKAARRRERAREAGVPLAVARALDGRRTVVILFRGGDSADDRATGRAVGALRGQRGVVVFTDRIGRLGRYRAVVGELGISQAPAVVIVDRGRSARVVQGYVDPTTLAQDVADTR